MRLKSVLTLILGSSSILIAGAFVLQHEMFAAADGWMNQGVVIPASARGLYVFAEIWSRFWWLGSLLIVIYMTLLVVAFEILGGPRRTQMNK
jgi:hypothetical protein